MEAGVPLGFGELALKIEGCDHGQGAIAALEQIQAAGIELIVMTLRRTSELNAAFEQYHLDRFFPTHHRYCLSDDYQKQGDIHDKTQLMAQALAELESDPNTWMVGDTETDIIAAQTHGITVIGVLSGIRDRDRLLQYQPDYILSDLAAAVKSIVDNPSIRLAPRLLARSQGSQSALTTSNSKFKI